MMITLEIQHITIEFIVNLINVLERNRLFQSCAHRYVLYIGMVNIIYTGINSITK